MDRLANLLTRLRFLIVFVLTSPLFFLRGLGVFDDTVFLKAGELVAQGSVPYRDFLDNKPPLLYLIAAIPAYITQGNWWAPRIMQFFFGLVFTYKIHHWIRLKHGEEVATFSSTVFALSFVLAQGYSFHSELWMAFVGILALHLIEKGQHLFWAGLVLAAAVLIKQVGALYFLAAIPFVPLRRQITLWLGFLTPFLLLLFWGLYLGIVPDIYKCTILAALDEAQGELHPSRWLSSWARAPILLILLLAIARRKAITRGPILIAGLLSLLPTLRDASGTTHFIGASVPLLSLAVAPGAHALWIERGWGTFLRAYFALASLALGVAILGKSPEFHFTEEMKFRDQFRSALSNHQGKQLVVLSGHEPRWHYTSGLLPYAGVLYQRGRFHYTVDEALNCIRSEKCIGVLEVGDKQWSQIRHDLEEILLPVPAHFCSSECHLVRGKR